MSPQTDGRSQLAAESGSSFAGWRHNWRVQALIGPPLIAPARQFVYPHQIAGEEDALARGAFRLLIYPESGGSFLATCALGFKDPAMPTAAFACPNPDELCAVAGGYAYIVHPAQPETCMHLALRPVVEVRALIAQELLLFVGFHSMVALGRHGVAWQTARLSWEGIRLSGVENTHLHGFGWDIKTDRELSFSLDLKTGEHSGGAF